MKHLRRLIGVLAAVLVDVDDDVEKGRGR